MWLLRTVPQWDTPRVSGNGTLEAAGLILGSGPGRASPTRALSQAITELAFPGRGPRPGPQLRVSQFGSVMRNLPVIEDGDSVRPPALSGCRKTTFTELLSFFLHLGSDLSLAGI